MRAIAIGGWTILFVILYSPVDQRLSIYFGERQSSKAVIQIANEAGFSLAGKSAFYKNSPEFVSANNLHRECPLENGGVEFGCFLPDKKKIYILDIEDTQFRDKEINVAVHETLHAVWASMNNSEKLTVSNEIKSVRSRYKNLFEYKKLSKGVSLYPRDKDLRSDELHSFMGANISGIDQLLERHYGKYFDNRVPSIRAHNRFISSLEGKISWFKSQRKYIAEQKLKAGQYYDESINDEAFFQIQRTNQYNGDYYNFSRNEGIHSQRLTYYKSLIRNINDLVKEYNSELQRYRYFVNSLYPDKVQETINKYQK